MCCVSVCLKGSKYNRHKVVGFYGLTGCLYVNVLLKGYGITANIMADSIKCLCIQVYFALHDTTTEIINYLVVKTNKNRLICHINFKEQFIAANLGH